MSEYKLSIIVPTFNLENIIDKTFNSIKSQTIGFENIEVIFVDDNSTDDTLNILKSYSNEFSNVYVFTTDENSGYAGKPRNIGLNESTSDYILFLDGDDQLLVNGCEVLYDKIMMHSADIAIGGQINVFENGIHQHNPPLTLGNERQFVPPVNDELLNIRPALPAKLFKKYLISKNNIKFQEGIPGQDLVFLLETIMNSSKTITLNNFYVYYRNLNTDSVTYKLTDDYFYGLIKAYCLVCDLFEKHQINSTTQKAVFQNHFGFFTERVMQAKYDENYKDTNLEEIFNSESFNELSNKNIFKSDSDFTLYFERMKNGEFNNRNLLNTIYKNLNLDNPIIYDLTYVKKEISKLNVKTNKLHEDNINLKKVNQSIYEENNRLSDENKKLTSELNEIKSSKLWKLKNKF